jgi:hypothetical protein
MTSIINVLKMNSNFINWSLISKFNSNRFINKSYVYLFAVPILAKFLALINSPLKLFVFGEFISFNIELPFNWKLFFYAALAFTMGAVLYNIFCPSVIKENKSLETFDRNKKSYSHLYKYLKEIGVDKDYCEKSNINFEYFQGISVIVDRNRNLIYQIESAEGIDEKRKIKMKLYANLFIRNSENVNDKSIGLGISFWNIYNYFNYYRITLLYLTFSLYSIGIVLFSIVLVKGVMTVINL